MGPFDPYILVLLQASNWGHCPPHPSSFQLAQTSFEVNLYLYNLIPVILLVHTTYEDGTDGVPKGWGIKFRCRGITQKKKYNIPNFIDCFECNVILLVVSIGK